MTHFELDRIDLHEDEEAALHPSWVFDHPRDVVNDPTLSVAEKRAILSSWASDACAVDSAPNLRQPPGARQAVTFDDVLDALQSLDDLPPPPRPGSARRRALVWPFGASSASECRFNLGQRESPAPGEGPGFLLAKERNPRHSVLHHGENRRQPGALAATTRAWS
jgi:hypothetical protein